MYDREDDQEEQESVLSLSLSLSLYLSLFPLKSKKSVMMKWKRFKSRQEVPEVKHDQYSHNKLKEERNPSPKDVSVIAVL